MEVAVAEEKKKIFRARKTMKISDRQQLEALHGTLLAGGSPSSSNSSSPPLLNGTHKEDGHKRLEKEPNDFSESKSPNSASPVSPASRGSPPLSLSLKLSPSPPPSKSPKAKEDDPPSPVSPFHRLNFELKKMEEEAKKRSSTSPTKDCSAAPPAATKENQDKGSVVNKEVANVEKKRGKTSETEKQEHAKVKEPVSDICKDTAKYPTRSPSALVVSSTKSDKGHGNEPDHTQPMETDGDSTEDASSEFPEAMAVEGEEKKSALSKATSSSSRSPSPCPGSSTSVFPEPEIKEEELKEDVKIRKDVKMGPTKEEVKSEKVETEKEKVEAKYSSKLSRPSSTPPSDTGVKQSNSVSGLKRTLSEGDELEGPKDEREGKKFKVEGMELEAQLELKITAKAGSRLKLEKVVQQLVEERLRELQFTVFDKGLQELKERVEKMDCATKHQTTLATLQAKIARLAKKFGEANQASENKKKQEALAVAAAASAKTAATTNTSSQRTFRAPVEVKQTSTPSVSSNAIAQPTTASPATTTAVVPQTPILQLINSGSNTATTLGTAITTQSPAGTLLLKTANQGPPLLIQVPFSMSNGQPGTVVNIPVSSLSAASPLNKSKTTTATFILKSGPSTTTAAASTSVTHTVPTLQASTSQMSPAQISLARAVYQGGAGGISTPSAGVSVTTARTPAQAVFVAGALSSASSPSTSGPAATGSTAPGPPQGTSLTSKTDNQATGSIQNKTAVAGARPKGSVIDLTEDDDDVQVTGVKNATSVAPPANQRPPPLISIPTNSTPRPFPQISQNPTSNAQITIHHRPPQDSPLKSRGAATPTTVPPRPPTVALPPLPVAPDPPGRLPPEAAQALPPQQPQLKLVPSQTGIVLSWCVPLPDKNCAAVESYHLYAFHQDNSNSNPSQQYWKKIGEVNALPLPMACTLTQFQSGSTYHFAVRAKDIYGRFGSFCEPQCTNVVTTNSG